MATCAFRWKHQWHRIARTCWAPQRKARQFKATRTAHWQQRVFRAALARQHGIAPQCNAVQSKAWHGNSKQRGSELGNRLFSGPLWSERKAKQKTAPQGMARQRTSKQRGSELGNRLFSGPLWSERIAAKGNATKANASHGKGKQRGSPTGNSGFSGPLWLTRPGFPSRFINGLTTEKTTWP